MATRTARRNLIMRDVVEEHAEEAAFLWRLRDAAVGAPHYSLRDLAQLDGRVEAHLDGVRTAGAPGWGVCAKAVADGAGEVFAGAVLAFESGRPDRAQAVVAAGVAAPGKARALVSALGWLPYAQAAPHVRQLAADADPVPRRVGLAAAAAHRQHPGQPLIESLDATDPALRARALRAVGELGLETSHPATRKSFSFPDPAVRFWANWSAALLVGDRDAVPNLQGIAEAEGPFQERAAGMAVRRLDPRLGKAWQAKLAGEPALPRVAVVAAGALGDPDLVPWLIDRMKAPALARVAGEAFTLITGVDLALQKLEGKRPEEPADDEGLNVDADADLPWPDPQAVARWWAAHQGSFPAGKG